MTAEKNEFNLDSDWGSGWNEQSTDWSSAFDSAFANTQEENPFTQSAEQAEQPESAAADPAAVEEDEDPNRGHDDDSLEPDEDVIYRERGLLYRLDAVERQWKERGTGVLKFLEHKETKKIRILMRRDHVLKVCANHFITSTMVLKPNAGSEKSFVWTTMADYADDEPKKETLAFKLQTAERMF